MFVVSLVPLQLHLALQIIYILVNTKWWWTPLFYLRTSKLFRWVDFALSDFESLEITFFSVPPNPSMDPFRCWRWL